MNKQILQTSEELFHWLFLLFSRITGSVEVCIWPIKVHLDRLELYGVSEKDMGKKHMYVL